MILQEIHPSLATRQQPGADYARAVVTQSSQANSPKPDAAPYSSGAKRCHKAASERRETVPESGIDEDTHDPVRKAEHRKLKSPALSTPRQQAGNLCGLGRGQTMYPLSLTPNTSSASK